MSIDRFQYDGDQLDEIVLTGVMFHLERMSQHGWWAGIYRDGDDLALNWRGGEVDLSPDTPWPGVERIVRPPLLGCAATWGDAHRCEDRAGHPGRHVCECRSWRGAR